MKVSPLATLAAVGVGLVILTRSRTASAASADDSGTLAADPLGGLGGSVAGVQEMAIGIAHAEGFFVAGSIPARAHNPGDLVIPGWSGDTLGSQRISVFASNADGWDRLHRQLQLILDGKSHVYDVDDSLAVVADKWTNGDGGAWLNNVLEYLNSKGFAVDGDTSIGDVLAA